MRSFRVHLEEAAKNKAEKPQPLPRSKEVKIRAFDRRHKVVGLTVMFAKHTKHKAGTEAYDFTLMEPTGRKYHGTVTRVKGAKGWIAAIEGKKGKKTSTGIGRTTSGNDLLAIRKAYENAAKDIGSTALPKTVKMISRGDAQASRL
jgi:hypothetical protein